MKLKYDFVLQEVGGLYMAVAVGEGAQAFKGMIRLNESAKRIFELIQEKDSEDAVVEALKEEYEAEEAILRASVDNVMGQLKKEGLLL